MCVVFLLVAVVLNHLQLLVDNIQMQTGDDCLGEYAACSDECASSKEQGQRINRGDGSDGEREDETSDDENDVWRCPDISSPARDPSAVDTDVADRKREARQNVLLQVSVYRFVVGACVCVCARVSVLREIQWEGLFAASLPKLPEPPPLAQPPPPNLTFLLLVCLLSNSSKHPCAAAGDS